MTQIDPNVFSKHLSESSLISKEPLNCLCVNTAEKLDNSTENAEDPYDLDIQVNAKNNGPSGPINAPQTQTCTCWTNCYTCWTCNPMCGR
jgi:hypothetical protein